MAKIQEQIELAKKLIDPLLARTIVDDGDRSEGNAKLMKKSEGDAVMFQMKLKGKKPPSKEYFLALGALVEDNDSAAIRCDGCTALALHVLATEKKFKGDLYIVEQGKGNATGHWFVLAGKPTELKYGKDMGAGCFVIDLWGAYVSALRKGKKAKTAVYYPAKCIYDCGDNTLKSTLVKDGEDYETE